MSRKQAEASQARSLEREVLRFLFRQRVAQAQLVKAGKIQKIDRLSVADLNVAVEGWRYFHNIFNSVLLGMRRAGLVRLTRDAAKNGFIELTSAGLNAGEALMETAPF